MISFCTICRDRLDHLKTTYINNLSVCSGHENILLSYGFDDDLDDYVNKHIIPFANEFNRKKILEGYTDLLDFNYYQVDAEYFHMSKSKNLVHRLGKGDIGFTLEADTRITISVIGDVLKLYEGDYYIGSHYTDNFVYAFKMEHFYKVGGFDETFQGWGWEDVDLRQRMQMIGLKYYQILPQSLEVLSHSDELRFRSYAPEYRSECREDSIRIFEEHKINNIIKVNINGFAEHTVIKNFNESFVI
jgi:hypothetical protein